MHFKVAFKAITCNRDPYWLLKPCLFGQKIAGAPFRSTYTFLERGLGYCTASAPTEAAPAVVVPTTVAANAALGATAATHQ